MYLKTKIHGAALCAAFALAPAAWAGAPITLTDANTATNPITYTVGPMYVSSQDAGCTTLPGAGATCDQTPLTINVTPGGSAGKRVVISIFWDVPQGADFDLYICKTSAPCEVGNSAFASAATADPEVARFPPVNGDYNILVDAYQPYGNTVDVQVYLEATPPSTPANTGPVARYLAYAPPGNSIRGGEPSIGTNWKSGTTIVGNSNDNAFITWDDCSSPAKDTWVNRPATTNIESFDPIMFTDHDTGRTIASQLISDIVTFSNGCSLSSVTDDDGLTWIPSEGCGPPSGADHQTVGGGPYHAPVPTLPSPAYGHAVYYCAQSVGLLFADSFCARSDDGGITYAPAVPAYTSGCGGVHGHPRVAPDGTVYLPNKSCGPVDNRTHGVVVSTDNGLTWTQRTIPGNNSGGSDPSVATGLNNTGKPGSQASNTVYYGLCDADGKAKVAVSRDQGATWTTPVDVGFAANIQNCVFPEIIAGDDNRAAFEFLGTPTAGPFGSSDFTGIWHAYVATTYDAGATWGLADATPDDPVQIGCIWLNGGGNPCRNLLDFNDIAIDKQGRPNFVFADGCVAPGCKTASAPNASRSSVNSVGRQSGGKTLFAAYDATLGARVVPGAPRLATAVRGANGITVSWSIPDEGASAITGYKIYRSTTSGAETYLATLSLNKNSYLDATADPGVPNYFYRVTAINGSGEGFACGQVSLTGVGIFETLCQLPGVSKITDPAADQATPGQNTTHDIVSMSVSEAFTTLSDKSVTFVIKVANLASVPPNSVWEVVWQQKDITGVSHPMFVEADTTQNQTNLVGQWGPVITVAGPSNQVTDFYQGMCATGTPAGSAPCPEVTVAADIPNNQIILKFHTDKRLTFNDIQGDQLFQADFPTGNVYEGLNANTQLLVGAAGTGQNVFIDNTSTVNYTSQGNVACAPNNPPLAVLAVTPDHGTAPLQVSFDGSGSNDPDAVTVGDIIAAYDLDFGDGSTHATGSGVPTNVVHTYAAGNWQAELTVTDSRGKASESPGGAQIAAGLSGLSFYTVAPCRVLDTRQQGGSLTSGAARELTITGACGIPASAKAVSFNLTVVDATGAGSVAFYPDAGNPPVPATVNFNAGQNRANNQVLGLAASSNGSIQAKATVAASGTVHAIVDVNGYFQ